MNVAIEKLWRIIKDHFKVFFVYEENRAVFSKRFRDFFKPRNDYVTIGTDEGRKTKKREAENIPRFFVKNREKVVLQ